MRFCDLVNALSGIFKHHVIAMDGCYDCADRIKSDVQVTFGPTPEKRPFTGRLLQYRRFLNACRPAILVTYNWGAIEWALANIVPLCPHVHLEDGFGPEEADRQLVRRVWFRRLVLTPHSTVVVPSRTLFEMARSTWRIPARRVRYIPNGVDTDRFQPHHPPVLHQRLGLSPATSIIGTVTRLGPEKNLFRLVDAFALVAESHDSHLVIVGDGAERMALESHVRAKGLEKKVSFLGHQDAPERLLTSFVIYAISSDTEQMPYGDLEAMAAGLPVAGVDVGDTKEIVSEENRPYIVEKDARTLAGSMSRLVADSALAHRIGSSNRRKVEATYSMDRMIADYQALFQACLAPRPSPAREQ